MGPEVGLKTSDSELQTFTTRKERFHGTGRKLPLISGELNGTVFNPDSLVRELRAFAGLKFPGRSRNHRRRGRRWFFNPSDESLI